MINLGRTFEEFFCLSTRGFHAHSKTDWFLVHGSGFILPKVQGALGLALAPCARFGWVLHCLSAAVGQRVGCGCGRVVPVFGCCGWLVGSVCAALQAGCLLQGKAVMRQA